jgi:hypothetical protein
MDWIFALMAPLRLNKVLMAPVQTLNWIPGTYSSGACLQPVSTNYAMNVLVACFI